ncbi:MAG: HAMP domain-containing histidine kinase, partial [Campylobacteraceae bacterium]|nr:HAMP domain-containing histidine kinase [Campylobacteraceae bacterium]
YFTTKHKKQGTGLGLYMTHQLIEVSMKGSISLDNEEYTYKDEVFKGACFKILLDL